MCCLFLKIYTRELLIDKPTKNGSYYLTITANMKEEARCIYVPHVLCNKWVLITAIYHQNDGSLNSRK